MSQKHNIGILLPYVTNIDEFRSLKAEILKMVEGQILSIGAVLETPSACMAIREFLGENCDLYLGTNDIMECFYGASRTLKSTAKYLQPYAPELFRFLSVVLMNAGTETARIGICGQLPLFPHVIKALIGIGFRRFSVEPLMIPKLASMISKQSLTNFQNQAERVLESPNAEAVFKVLSESTS